MPVSSIIDVARRTGRAVSARVDPGPPTAGDDELRRRVDELEAEVRALRQQVGDLAEYFRRELDRRADATAGGR